MKRIKMFCIVVGLWLQHSHFTKLVEQEALKTLWWATVSSSFVRPSAAHRSVAVEVGKWLNSIERSVELDGIMDYGCNDQSYYRPDNNKYKLRSEHNR